MSIVIKCGPPSLTSGGHVCEKCAEIIALYIELRFQAHSREALENLRLEALENLREIPPIGP